MEKRNNAVGPQVNEGKKKPKKFLPFLTLISALAGFQAATQFFAYKLMYQPILGWNVQHIYPFWSILIWRLKWHVHLSSYVQDTFSNALFLGTFVMGCGLLLFLVVSTMIGRSPQANEYLHGSARWANKDDITRAGLLKEDEKDDAGNAVYVGGWMDGKTFRYLRHSGPEHVLTYAPTRAGKGVGLVIPTLLSWTSSVVIADLKGELRAITAGWRQQYAQNKVIFWEPASSTSARWNPLHEIRLEREYEMGDVQNIANLIVDPDGKGFQDNHWAKTSNAALCGLIIHVIYEEKAGGRTASLAEIDRLLSDPENVGLTLWRKMQKAKYYTDPESGQSGLPHPTAVRAATDIINTPEEERGSILSTARSFLSLYRDPIIQRNTECCDYRISDLMNHESPVSLYIITQPVDKARLQPLVKLKFNMIIRLLATKMEFEKGRTKKTYRHRLLLMIDEFPSLGKLPVLQEALAFMAGYGIKAYLITQDIPQLTSEKTGYGRDESIRSNCHVQNAYPPNREETAEYMSKLCGTTTIVKESITESGRRSSFLFGQVSRTLQETARPLLTMDEALRMPGPKKKGEEISEPGDMIISVSGFPAIYGKQPLFFKDPTFLARASIDPPKCSDVLREPSSLRVKNWVPTPKNNEVAA